MELYFNCYTIGEGYTLKRCQWPQETHLEEVSRKQMPEQERAVFTGTGAPYLFLGTIEGRRFGCVRELETALYDENGRRCYLHFAAEAGLDDAPLVDALLDFAFDCRGSFVRMCNAAIHYADGNFQLNAAGFLTLTVAATERQKQAGGRMRRPDRLIPATSPEQFFSESKIDAAMMSTMDILTLQQWTSRETSLSLFLYCSTPSSGFTLGQIDPASGQKLRIGKDAHGVLLPNAQTILTHSGANMALFKQSGQICFVAKGIRSTSTDRYGRTKHMSIVLQAPESQGLPVRQLAAWALLDFAAFSDQLTDCVKIYSDARGYEVSGAKIFNLIHNVTPEISLPREHAFYKQWNQIVYAQNSCTFPLLATEASLQYFCRECGVDLMESQVGLLVSMEEWERIKKTPLGFTFGPELYRSSAPEAQTDHAHESMAAHTVPAIVPKQDVPEAVVCTSDRECGRTDEPQEMVDTGNGAPIAADDTPQNEEKEAGEPLDGSTAQTGVNGQEQDGQESDSIDLLRSKWFIPAALIVLLIGAGAIALWLHFQNR